MNHLEPELAGATMLFDRPVLSQHSWSGGRYFDE